MSRHAEEATIRAGGIDHHTRLDGTDGPWVVFSNSLGCTLEMWDAQVDALRAGYRTFRYDTRGHGRSGTSPGPYTMDLLAGDLLGLLAAAGIEECTLVGLSMGGMLGQVAALTEPQRFSRLLFADTTSRYGPEVAEFWATRARTALDEGLAPIAQTTPKRWFTPGYATRHPEVVERYRTMLMGTDPAGYAGCCAAISAIDVTDRLAAVTVPTLVVVGAQDPSTTPEHAKRIHDAIGHSRLAVIDDAAHFSNVEQPERFNELLAELLKETKETTTRNEMTPGYPAVPFETVAEQIRLVVSAWGMKPDDVQKTVDAMVDADLRGIDSHGISMLMAYAALLANGSLHPDAERRLLAETPATATIDAGGGLGHPVAVDAMRLAIEKARTVGIGAVAVTNSLHFGALGYYVRLAAASGLMGLAMTSTRLTSVIPTGARQSKLGTNPLAFAAPASRHEPFVLDMSTSTVASNKVRSYALKHLPLPGGWVVNGQGDSVTEAGAAYEAIVHDEFSGLTPLGGPGTVGGGHKGYGLNLMVQILSSALSGAGMPGTGDIGHLFLALQPEAFGPAGAAEAYVSELVDTMHASEPLTPGEPVLVAGEPEFATSEVRRKEGIPMPDDLLAQLRELCDRGGIRYVLQGEPE